MLLDCDQEHRYASAAQLMRALSELDLPSWTQADAATFWAAHAATEDARQSRVGTREYEGGNTRRDYSASSKPALIMASGATEPRAQS